MLVIQSLFRNMYVDLLKIDDPEDDDVIERRLVSLSLDSIKIRKIECDAKDHALGFWYKHDRNRFYEYFEREERDGQEPLTCFLKNTMNDTLVKKVQDLYTTYTSASSKANPKVGWSDDMFGSAAERVAVVDSIAHAVIRSGGGSTNQIQSRARRIFHALTVTLFGDHKEYVHNVMCRPFIANNSESCPVWVNFVRVLAESRLSRFTNELYDPQNLRIVTKQWKMLFPNYKAQVRSREIEVKKLRDTVQKHKSVKRLLRPE